MQIAQHARVEFISNPKIKHLELNLAAPKLTN